MHSNHINTNSFYNFSVALFKIFLIAAFFILSVVVANASVYTVTNTSDSGAGSLRQAIINANANPGADNISFNIAAGSGVRTIKPLSTLPAITDSLTINGYTQPGYAGSPLIALDGSADNYTASILNIYRGDVIINAVNIHSSTQHGISVACPSYSAAQAQDCIARRPTLILKSSRIGTDAAGATALPNYGSGVYISTAFAGSITIGGNIASDGNVISGNYGHGIESELPIGSSQDYQDATRKIQIYGNVIGTNVVASSPNLGNHDGGISLSDYPQIIIGGTTALKRNLVSGNRDGDGIYINQLRIAEEDASTVIEGNYIGTNADASAALANEYDGIRLTAVRNAIIGGTASGAGNVVSGNGADGIGVTGEHSSGTNSGAASNIQILGNRIGTNANGTQAIANADDGIEFNGYYSKIGLPGNPTAANIIAGNGGDGINFIDYYPGNGAGYVFGAANNIVAGNYVGTNAAGANLGNAANGIAIVGKSSGNSIGGATAAHQNVIAYNGGAGIYLNELTGIYINQNSHISRIPQDNELSINKIYSNGRRGIEFYDNDSQGNDAADADAGVNNLQNAPILNYSFSGNSNNPQSTPTILGTFHSTPNTAFRVDFYSNTGCDASGRGEGANYINSKTITTDANGNAAIETNFGAAAGTIITAVATSPATLENSTTGNTSEFSNCVTTFPGLPSRVQFSSANYTVDESGNQIMQAVVTRTNPGGAFSVNYATSDGSAIAGQDYTATSGVLNFGASDASKAIVIPIVPDNLDEPDEMLEIALSNPTGGASLGSPSQATATITDDDATPQISVADVSLTEGNEGVKNFNFVVSLSSLSGSPVTVNYQTAGGTATSNIDFTNTGGILTFASGENSKTISVPVYGDLTVETDETFTVNLSNAVHSAIADAQAAGTILDDDNAGKLQFALAPYNAAENAGFATVTVSRTGGTAGTVTVDHATNGSGTATAYSDFTPASDTLTFLDGETTKTFQIAVIDDQIAEQTETVGLILSNPTGGATLGAISQAFVNIADNDAGTPLEISGIVKKADNTPLSNAQVNLTGTQNAQTTTDQNGRYSFQSLTPNGSYSVHPIALGYVFTPVSRAYSNLTATVANANFTATSAPNRQLRIVGGDAVSGQTATATIELVAQGDENSVGFSLNFDANILSNPNVVLAADAANASLVVNSQQATNGKLGILLAMPAGQTFAPGAKHLISVTFDTAQTNLYQTPIVFGDQPLAREISSVNADALIAEYANGAIYFAQGFESDVAPRPTGSGNGTITVADFTQIGKFVAGVDQMNAAYNEFQRADSAPRISKGNGALTVSDYTQAGRYAAGLDPVQQTGGASSPVALRYEESGKLSAESLDRLFGAGIVAELLKSDPESEKTARPDAAPRIMRVVNAQTAPGSQVVLLIEVDANGDENAFGFTLNYDAAKLGNPIVALGSGAANATLIPNTQQAGKIGIVLAFPTGQTISAGTKQLVTIRFDVAPNAPGGQIPITFGDAPVFRETVNANADVLPTAYQSGAVSVLGPTAANVNAGGRILTADGGGIARAMVTMTLPNGETRTVLANQRGFYRFTDIPAGATYIFSVRAKRFQFSASSQLWTILEDTDDVNFTADGNTILNP